MRFKGLKSVKKPVELFKINWKRSFREDVLLEKVSKTNNNLSDYWKYCFQSLKIYCQHKSKFFYTRFDPYNLDITFSSQTYMTKFCPLLTTYLPLVDICEWIPGKENLSTAEISRTTYLPCLVNVVCGHPLSQKLIWV